MSISKIKYITALLLYGSIGMILHYISAPSEFVVLCRGVIGTITILIITSLKSRKIGIQSIKSNLTMLLLSGACLGLNWLFLFEAYRVTTVAVASLCNYTAPIIVLILTTLLNKEKFNANRIICILSAGLGIVFISGVLGESGSNFNFKGLLLGFGAALGFVGLVIFNRKLNEIDAMDKSIVQLSVSAIVVLPYVLIVNHGLPIVKDTQSIVLILLLGILQTGIAYIFYLGSISEISIESVAILGYLEPVLSVILSATVLKEKISLFGILGAILIIGASIYNELSSIKKLH